MTFVCARRLSNQRHPLTSIKGTPQELRGHFSLSRGCPRNGGFTRQLARGFQYTRKWSENDKIDKDKIVTSERKEQICSEYETDGFREGKRKVRPSQFVYYH